jgi:NAD(P)-dependent dehydrogenase (short-subunit alcohol dehydrogenase family)
MSAQLRFDGRVAVVTGAGRGVGRAHALLLASRGAAVVVNDVGFERIDGGARGSGPADEVVGEISASGGRAAANHEDIATAAGARRLVEQALDSFGRLDVAINNAGTNGPRPFGEMTEEEFDFMIRNHLSSSFHVAQAAWPRMAAAGYGRLVLTTSGAAFFGIPGMAHYCAAKGAVYGLMRSLALEAPAGVQVNGFWPSAATRMVGEGELRERMERSMPPRLAAPVAVWLAHETCPLNGEVLHGGSGRASRVFVAETKGMVRRELSLEDIAERQDEMLREDGYLVFKTAMESSEAQTRIVDAELA